MKSVLGIAIVLLVVTQSDLQWQATQAATDGRIHSAEPATSAAASSPGDTMQTAAPEASLRLVDAMEEKATDYNGQSHWATSEYESCTVTGTARGTERYTAWQAPHYEDEPTVVPCEDGLHPATVKVEGATSTATQKRSYASPGETTADPSSTATVSTGEEWDGSTAPEAGDWISWLPAKYQHWPRDGPLGVSRDEQLKAFKDALVQHSVEIRTYLIPTAEQEDTDELGTEEPQTHYVTFVVHKIKLLPEFYKWMFRQLNMTEPNAEHVPKSLFEFLEALQHHSSMVKEICNLSPYMDLTCSVPEPGSRGDFFWLMDQQLIWVHVFHHWAANQYNLTALPHTNTSWWLPHGLHEGTLVNVTFFPTLTRTGEELGREELSATGERDVMVGSADSEDTPTENYWSDSQLDQQEQNGEEELPWRVSLSIPSTVQETEQLTGEEWIPVIDGEPESSSEEGGNYVEDRDVIYFNPDEGSWAQTSTPGPCGTSGETSETQRADCGPDVRR